MRAAARSMAARHAKYANKGRKTSNLKGSVCKIIPTGLRPKAQGWRTSAEFGQAVKNENNANGVEVDMAVMSR